MEENHADTQVSFNPNEILEPPPIDNIHSEHQPMDTGVPYNNAIPAQVNVCQQIDR